MARDLVDTDSEQITTSPMIDHGAVAVIARAELDTLISTARSYPRSFSAAQRRLVDLATLDEEAAADCIYSLPRAGKAVEGPSIRYAEMCAQAFGNCRVAARTVAVDRVEKYVEAEGFFLDAETNVATLARVRRRISDKRGRLLNDDMILVTSNAAQSIARRNAILAGVPKAIWRKGYDAARQVIMGDVKTLANRREAALKSFARFGLTVEQVLKITGHNGIEDIGQEQMVALRGTYSGLMNGETTVEELLRAVEPEKAARVTALSATTAAPTPFEDDLPLAPTASAPAAAAQAASAAPSLSKVETETEAADDVDTLVASFTGAMDAASTVADVERIWSSVAALGADAVGDRITALGKVRDAALARVRTPAAKAVA